MSSHQEHSLSRLLTVDTCAAACSAFSTAIFASMIDQAVTQNTSGTATLKEAFSASFSKLLKYPHRYVTSKAYLAVALVYTGTYMAANYTQTFCDQKNISPIIPKLTVTTGVNVTLGVTKDSLFAIWFGGKGAAGGGLSAFPLPSWGLFIVRDISTMAAGFILPAKAAEMLYQRQVFKTKVLCEDFAQMTVPIVCQAFLTPIHLLSLDIYNRPVQTLAERFNYVRSIYLESAISRSFRVLAIYGIGGVLNKHIKKVMLEAEDEENDGSRRDIVTIMK